MSRWAREHPEAMERIAALPLREQNDALREAVFLDGAEFADFASFGEHDDHDDLIPGCPGCESKYGEGGE